MSVINLTSFFTFNSNSRPKSVVARDVDIKGESLQPENAFIGLYGFREVLEEMQVIQAAEKGPNIIFCPVRVEVDIGVQMTKPVDITTLPETRFLNMRRISTNVRTLVEKYWNGYLREEALPLIGKEELREMAFIGKRQDLLSRLQSEPEFAHLDVIVYQGVDADNRYTQRAALFSLENVKLVQAPNHPEIDVELPTERFELNRSHSPRM